LARPGSRASSTHDDHVDDIAIAAIETPSSSSPSSSSLRRSILLRQLAPSLLAVVATTLSSEIADAAPLPSNAPPNLDYVTTPTGLQYADVRPGVESASSPPPTDGQYVSIDYVMSTTGARYGSKIYSTVDAGAPYRWTLGDGSTMPGLEEAVRGMRPGGIRRVIIPPGLAYRSTSAAIREFSFRIAEFSSFVASVPLHADPASRATSLFFFFPGEECESGKGLGPIPPASGAMGEFQRFKNIYCNPDRVYQPDLVMDVKLYGKR
jgi:FKBP-type peptidyl-prolyl cis-trans isomerase